MISLFWSIYYCWIENPYKAKSVPLKWNLRDFVGKLIILEFYFNTQKCMLPSFLHSFLSTFLPSFFSSIYPICCLPFALYLSTVLFFNYGKFSTIALLNIYSVPSHKFLIWNIWDKGWNFQPILYVSSLIFEILCLSPYFPLQEISIATSFSSKIVFYFVHISIYSSCWIS